MSENKKTKFLLKSTGMILLMLVLIIVAGSIDEKKKEFPELAYTAPVVADEDNGFSVLMDAHGALVDSDQLYKLNNDEEFDIEFWSEWLEKNHESFRLFDKALTFERLYEKVEYSIAYSCESLCIVEFTNSKRLEVQVHTYKGDYQKAIKVIEQLQLLSKKIRRDNHTLIHTLVGLAVDKMISQSINHLIEKSENIEDIKHSIHLLNLFKTRPLEEQMKLAFISEYKFQENTISNMKESMEFSGIEYPEILLINPYSVHKNRVLNTAGEYYTSLIDTTLYNPHFFRPLVATKVTSKYRDYFAYLAPNGFGNVSTKIIYTLKDQGLKIYAASATYDLMKIKAAARIYYLQTGKYPANLDALTSILGEIPTDPFQKNNEPYGYDPLKGIAWSIGTNFVEDVPKVKKEYLYKSLYDDKEIVLQLFEPEH